MVKPENNTGEKRKDERIKKTGNRLNQCKIIQFRAPKSNEKKHSFVRGTRFKVSGGPVHKLSLEKADQDLCCQD
jgi:hypothetical protein